MREIFGVLHTHIQKLDVEELVDRVQIAADGQICAIETVAT